MEGIAAAACDSVRRAGVEVERFAPFVGRLATPLVDLGPVTRHVGMYAGRRDSGHKGMARQPVEDGLRRIERSRRSFTAARREIEERLGLPVPLGSMSQPPSLIGLTMSA